MHTDDAIKHLRFQAHHSLIKLPTRPDALMHLSPKMCASLTSELGERLNSLQNLMHASSTKGLLVVLQGMDTAGKMASSDTCFKT